jgi:hypothetical protein
MGAVWPAAKPGVDYCGPYPACCPPAARTWWQHLLGFFNPHGDWSLIALEAGMAAFFAAFCVFLFGGNALQRHWQQGRENGRRR